MMQPTDFTENVTKLSQIWRVFEKDNTLKHNGNNQHTRELISVRNG